MIRAVISGATGAIGSALVETLTENGVEVLILSHPDSARPDNIPRGPLVTVLECGMKDYTAAENTTGKEYDVFYHLAWAGASGPGRNDMYLQNDNVKYALDAVGMAKRFGCRRFIGAGSQAEYGRVEGLLRPDTPTHPEMGYGYAKLCAGEMTRDYAHQLGMEHIWTRILSVYGPNDGTQSMVMSTVIKLLAGEVPQLTKGEQIWDYLYSKDAARAFYLLGDKGKDGKTYVMGSGTGRPLAEYVRDIRDVVAPQGSLHFGAVPYSPKQVMYLCADVTELQQDTGWSAETDFREGIRQTVESV